ncbi:hypothetical protein MFIFM68171_08699 [Madurella fahalii]|uniref:Peptidase S8/S53 domain-containing protein n=1 Tax=Madurella fahalii TaxID=1157608 RepID=A0ABQ0GL62_9PEZI
MVQERARRQESDSDYSDGSGEDPGDVAGGHTSASRTASEVKNRDSVDAPALCRAILLRHLISRSPGVLLIGDHQNRTPYQLRLEQIGVSLMARSRHGQDMKDKHRRYESATASDSILSYIRAYCIRNFNAEDTIRALYPPGQEKSINFNLIGIAAPVPEDHLNWLERHLTLESVLSQVTLPSIKSTPLQPGTETTNDVAARRAQYSNARRTSRRDAVRVFSWLRKRGVEKVIKVVVMDTDEHFHDDEAIENALEGFEVEKWDWKRYDIPSGVIARSTSAVEDVTLYFSGNDAILDDWGGAEGFGNESLFPELRRVQVQLDPGVSNEELRVAILRKLRRRNVVVEVGIDIGSKSSAKTRDGIDSLSKSFWSLFDRIYPSQDLPRIKIAIIDDGIDVMEHGLAEMVAGGLTFSDSPYFVSMTGHGTALARVIQRLCPHSRLYVAKLPIHTDEVTLAPRIDPLSIAKALRWATGHKVDMICIGFTQSFPASSEALTLLAAPVGGVVHEGTAILVPAGDPGRVDESSLSKFIGTTTIGDNSSHGPNLQWVGSGGADFLFDGFPEAITSQDGAGNLEHIVSGSSIATAVACGFAALLLHLRRLPGSADRREVAHPPDSFIRNVFRGMVDKHQPKYVSVRQALLDMVGNGRDEQAFKEKVERYAWPYM